MHGSRIHILYLQTSNLSISCLIFLIIKEIRRNVKLLDLDVVSSFPDFLLEFIQDKVSVKVKNSVNQFTHRKQAMR